MISLVRFISRRFFAKNRWVRRIVFVVAIARWLTKRSDTQYEIQIRRDEHVDVVVSRMEQSRDERNFCIRGKGVVY